MFDGYEIIAEQRMTVSNIKIPSISKELVKKQSHINGCEKWNPLSAELTEIAAMIYRRDHTLTAAVNGKTYIFCF